MKLIFKVLQFIANVYWPKFSGGKIVPLSFFLWIFNMFKNVFILFRREHNKLKLLKAQRPFVFLFIKVGVKGGRRW